jgi:DNA-binding MarR family transcriptional regulator
MSLYLLGRKLMKIAEGALPRGRAVMSSRLIFVDVAYHQNSSISEITERTGFPQSLVSTSVAKLREMGLLESGPDPLDRRRTLVRTTPALTALQERLGSVGIDDLIARELATGDQEELPHVIDALELLSRLLTPEVTPDGGVASVTHEAAS